MVRYYVHVRPEWIANMDSFNQLLSYTTASSTLGRIGLPFFAFGTTITWKSFPEENIHSKKTILLVKYSSTNLAKMGIDWGEYRNQLPIPQLLIFGSTEPDRFCIFGYKNIENRTQYRWIASRVHHRLLYKRTCGWPLPSVDGATYTIVWVLEPTLPQPKTEQWCTDDIRNRHTAANLTLLDDKTMMTDEIRNRLTESYWFFLMGRCHVLPGFENVSVRRLCFFFTNLTRL